MKKLYNSEQLIQDIIQLCLCRGTRLEDDIYVCKIGLVTMSYDKCRRLINLMAGTKYVSLNGIMTDTLPGSVILQAIVDLEDN